MNRIQEQFSLLKEKVHDKPIVYLGNTATAQRSVSISEAVDDFYRHDNANPHRGVYKLAVRATDAFEDACKVATGFIDIRDAAELTFTCSATEALNLIAYSYDLNSLSEGDGITIPIAEHHSSLVPWQYVARMIGTSLDYLYLINGVRISDEKIAAKTTEKTKLASVAHIFNVLGVQPPVEKIVRRTHEVGAIVVLDCVQSIPHFPVDVEKLGMDSAIFSGHEMHVSLGIGALWGCRELPEKMPPFPSDGDMVDSVEEQVTMYAPTPQKSEAGTQDTAGAVDLATAVKFMQEIGWEKITRVEHELMVYALEGTRQIPHVAILNDDTPADERYDVILFPIGDVHPHNVASILDTDGVCVHVRHHCVQSLLHHLDVYATSRISFVVYNTKEDIDAFLKSLKRIRGAMDYGAQSDLYRNHYRKQPFQAQ